MDVSTDSDSGEELAVETATHDVHVKNLPAFMAWRDPSGESQSLSDLGLVLDYSAATKKALVRLQASAKLKKVRNKTSMFLFIRPDQIQTLACVGNEDVLDGFEEEQNRHAREKLGTNTYALRFELRNPATFVVPKEWPYKSFKLGSQAAWKSWTTFSRGTLRFVVHIPMRSISKAQLVSFCQSASSRETAALDDNISSLYGGKGGRVIDPNADDETEGAEAGAEAEAEVNPLLPDGEDDAPPAYEDRVAAGPSISGVEPPLCLSPQREAHSRKRRRRSSTELEQDAGAPEKGLSALDRILQCMSRLEQTVYEIRDDVKKLEHRISRLEEQQKGLAEELETQVETQIETRVEPLWEELDTRLLSQEDQDQDYIKDTIIDALDEVDEKIDKKIDERVPDTVDQYLRNHEGRGLIHEIVGERMHEDIRDFLRTQHFTGHFTISDSK